MQAQVLRISLVRVRDRLFSELALNNMRKLAETCEAIAATTKKLEKTAIVAGYLQSRSVEEAAVSAVFLAGRVFAAWEDATLQVGGAMVGRLVAELSGKDEGGLTAAY